MMEQTYATRKLEHVTAYKNESAAIECFTLICGQAVCDGVSLRPGMTVLLWPQESICNAEVRLAFVSKLREGV